MSKPSLKWWRASKFWCTWRSCLPSCTLSDWIYKRIATLIEGQRELENLEKEREREKMARGMIKNMVVVAAAVTMLILIESTAAETFIVGDDNGWSIPPSAGFYSSWAAKHTFAVNDTLDFNFFTGSHAVVMVTSKDAYDNCDSNLDKNAKEFKTGPAEILLANEGEVFFFCIVGNHCSLGQKLAINVVAASAKPLAPANSPSPPESRQDTGSAPKPMALTLSTFCLCLMALVAALGSHFYFI